MVRGLKILLASSSPRRIELLNELGVEFTHLTPKVEEDDSSCDPIKRVEENARRKAMSITANGYFVIGADTVVVLGERILGKPKDRKDAMNMLKALSGKVHQVFTAVCVKSDVKTLTSHACTKVWFKELTQGQIEEYVDTEEPLDKAGSYGIQGLGGFLVDRIEGSYSNVVGLPLELLRDMLSESGIEL